MASGIAEGVPVIVSRAVFVAACIAAFNACPCWADDVAKMYEDYRERLGENWAPEFIHRDSPNWKYARPGLTSGCVVVDFEFMPDGSTDHFVVLESKPAGGFDQAALKALSKWRIKPTGRTHRAIQPFTFAPPGGKSSENCDYPYARLSGVWVENDFSGTALESGWEAPYYPPLALQKRVEGCVSIKFEVRPDGQADNYEVVDAKPQVREFMNVLLYALKTWRFVPAARGNRFEVRYDFVIDDPKKQLPSPCLSPAERKARDAGKEKA